MPETAAVPALAAAALYAGLHGLMLIWLSVAVVRERLRARVSLGDGGDAGLSRAMRAHGNFTENAPLILLIIALAALLGAPAAAVHAAGLALLVGRLMHALCLLRPGASMKLRQGGMALTYLSALVGALALIGLALTEL